MISVEFLGPIKEETLILDVKNLYELKQQLEQIPSIAKWLPTSALAINDEFCESIDMELKDGDKVVILPPVCGGGLRA